VRVLITGATANVGTSVARAPGPLAHDAGGPLRLREFLTGIGRRP
jgi:hypothetical protein